MKEERPAKSRFAIRTPWWASVLLAVICYCTLKYLVPQLQSTSPALAKLIQAAPSFAPIVTIPLLLLAAKQLYDTDGPGEKDGDKDEDGRED